MARILSKHRSKVSGKAGNLVHLTPEHPGIETFDNIVDEYSKIVRIRPPTQSHKIILPMGLIPDIFPDFSETFTTDASGGNKETFSLTHAIDDYKPLGVQTSGEGSGEVDFTGDQLLVLYDASTQKLPNTIDLAAGEFTYEDADTGSTLTVYYPPKIDAKIEFRKFSPNSRRYTPVYKTRMKDQLLIPRFEADPRKIQRIMFGRDVEIVGEEYVDVVIQSSIDLADWDKKEAYPNFEALGIVEEASEQEIRQAY